MEDLSVTGDVVAAAMVGDGLAKQIMDGVAGHLATAMVSAAFHAEFSPNLDHLWSTAS